MNKRFANTAFESVNNYIEYCRKKFQSTASEFCVALDKELDPVVFVIGVYCGKDAKKDILYISPKGIDYEWLVEVEKQAQEFFRQYNNQGSQLVDSRFILKNFARGFIKASFQKFATSIERIDYSSEAIMIEDFAIFAICLVNSSPIRSKHSLSPKNEASISLVDGAFKAFLNAIPSYFFQAQDPTSILKITSFPSSYEILRTASKNLLTRISFRVPSPDQIAENMPKMKKAVTFFEDLNAISRTKYESEKAVGTIIVAERNHPNVEILVEFANPVWSHEHRASRKLLEMSNNDINLLYYDGDFYGLGQCTGEYSVKDENLFVIRIKDHYIWSLHHAEHTMMVVSYEQPRLYADEPTDYVVDFQNALDVEFSESGVINKEKLTGLFEMALKQSHGTMLVINDQAQIESSRLSTQSTLLKPSNVSETLMKTITSIDGAVMIDPEGVCYAIGVILDGIIEEGEGDPSRGARLNAAFKYLSHCKRNGYRCLIAVISEDGMVNIFYTNKDNLS